MSYWNPGDQAFCINSVWRSGMTRQLVSGPKFGHIYLVRDVGFFEEWDTEVLWFSEFPGNGITSSYLAEYFRKLDPLKESDEDKEVIDIMKGLEVV